MWAYLSLAKVGGDSYRPQSKRHNVKRLFKWLTGPTGQKLLALVQLKELYELKKGPSFDGRASAHGLAFS
jgi:hypothetical protein